MKSFTLIFLFVFNICSAQQFLKNINPGTESSNPKEFISVGDTSYFVSRNNDFQGLYSYNSSTETTSLVSSTYTFFDINNLFVFKGDLYLWALTNSEGFELYKLNKQTNQISLFKAFFSGSQGSNVDKMVICQNKFYLFFNNPNELWVSDGTTINTSKLVNYNNSYTNLSIGINDKLFFVNDVSSFGPELWVSNGTVSGTTIVKDIFPGSNGSSISHMKQLGNNLVFTAYNFVSSTELWITDGIEANTNIISELGPGSVGSFPNSLNTFNNEIFFNANGNNYYKTDGINITFLSNVFSSTQSIEYNNEFYFVGYSSNTGFELWKSNGTQAGTNLVADVFPGIGNGFPNVLNARDFKVINGKIIFKADNGTNGLELMSFDGQNISLVKDFNASSSDSYIGPLYKFGNKLAFSSESGSNERDIWITDGTFSGTTLIKNINTQINLCNTYFLGSNLDKLFLIGYTNEVGFEPFLYNTTSNSVSLLRECNTGPRLTYNIYENINSFKMQKLGSNYLFWADDSKHGTELWVTDGTSIGTYLLKDFTKISYGYYYNSEKTSFKSSSHLSSWIRFNNEIYLTINGRELWKINANLELVLLFNSNEDLGNHRINLSMIDAGDKLFFTLGPNKNLFHTNGTIAGTQIVDNQTTLVNLYDYINSELIFSGQKYPYGQELLKYSNSSITLIKDINNNQSSSISLNENFLFKLNGKVIFEANDGINGSELWVTDGSSIGTHILKDFALGTNSSSFSSNLCKKLGNSLLFVANDGVSGNEIWKTDGTVAGTSLLKDISQGTQSSNFYYTHYQIDSSKIVYIIDNGILGFEPWITDGTSQNTNIINDFSNGSSNYDFDPKLFENKLFQVINTKLWISNLSNGQSNLASFDINPISIASEPIVYKTNLYIFGNLFNNSYEVHLFKYENGVFKKQKGNSFNLNSTTGPTISNTKLINNKLIYQIFTGDLEYYVSELCEDFEIVNVNIESGGTIKANTLNANSIINTSQKVFYTAEKSIQLNPGFNTIFNSNFKAEISGCKNLN